MVHANAATTLARAPRENRSEILEKRRTFASGKLAKYRIEVGKDQGVMPKEIVGAIANECGIEGKYIGQINLFDSYSTVELPANLPADVMDILQRVRVKQQPLRTRVLAEGEFIEPPPRRRTEGAFGGKPGFSRERSDAPRREFSDAPRRAPSDAPRREFSDAPRRDVSDRPKSAKPYGDRERPAYGKPAGDKPPFAKGGFDAPRRAAPTTERTGARSGPGTIRADRPARAKPAGKKFSR